MQSAIEASGVFWLVSNPDDSVAGTLRFDPENGAELELIGAFGGVAAFNTEELDYGRILGVAEGKLFTLERCWEKGKRFQVPGIVRQNFHIGMVFEGAHLEQEGELLFGAIDVEIAGLAQWILRSGTTLTIEAGVDDAVKGVNVAFSPVPDEECEIPDGQLKLGFGWGLSGDHIEETVLTQRCYFRIDVDEPQELSSLLGYTSALQDLLALAAGDQGRVESITVRHADVVHKLPSGRVVHEAISVHFKTARSTTQQAIGRTRHDFAFSFADLGGLGVVASWIQIARRHSATLALLLASRGGEIPFQEIRYLNALMAAEWFHREEFTNRILPKQEFRTRVSQIVDTAPDETRDWLRQVLQHANEPRLRDRLAEVAASLGEDAALLIPDVERWAKACSKLRNGLTHHGGTLETAVVAEALHYLTASVFFIVAACLLNLADQTGSSGRAVLNGRSSQWIASRLEGAIVEAETLAT